MVGRATLTTLKSSWSTNWARHTFASRAFAERVGGGGGAVEAGTRPRTAPGDKGIPHPRDNRVHEWTLTQHRSTHRFGYCPVGLDVRTNSGLSIQVYCLARYGLRASTVSLQSDRRDPRHEWGEVTRPSLP